MGRKGIIAIVIIVVVIIIGVVGYLIYKSNKNKAIEEAKKNAAILQAQLNANPNMAPAQKQDILGQLAALALQIQGGVQQQQTYVDPNANPNPNPYGYNGPFPNPNPNPVVAPYGFPLQQGSTQKNYVMALQNAINAKCSKNLVPDGKFGPLTKAAAQSCLGSSVVSWDTYKGLGLS